MQNVFGFYVHNMDDHHVKILITFLLCSNYKSHYLDIDSSNNGFSLQKFDRPSLNAWLESLQREIRSISPYSVRIRENTDQNNSE